MRVHHYELKTGISPTPEFARKGLAILFVLLFVRRGRREEKAPSD